MKVSDINPMTGSPINPVPTIQQVPKPRVNFEDPSAKKLDTLVNSEEAQEFQRIADAASRTKFATGDRDTDIRSYIQFRKSIDNLLGLLGENG